MIGKALAHYEITERIGAGGMGEVYRARDTKLGRDVALKLLPAAFAQDAERLARFQREAKLLASLNHPNIAHLYGLEDIDGVVFLVMELVEGADLSERIRGRGLPLAEALRIARAVADALSTAHEQGVVHRDLKPANIKITPDGDTRVLDFGLAKALEGEPGDPNLSQSPTLTALAGTSHGVILGTAAYMSPEQARGKSLDRRTDVWSFGCVLFEMLTGQQAFPGETVSDTIARILEREPDWSLLPADTPAGVHRLLRRCLEKDQKKRLGDIGDARYELDDTISGTSGVWPGHQAVPAATRPGARRSRAWAIAATALLALAVGFVAGTRVLRGPDAPVTRTLIEAPRDGRFLSVGDYAGPVVVSPDGSKLAFVATDENLMRRVWVRDVGQLEPRPLPGTENARFPFWAADGSSLAFFADHKLKRMALSGGLPITVCDAPNGRGGAWNQDGTMLVAPDFRSPISRVPAAGGTPTAVTRIDTSMHTTHRWPQFMPDGRHFIYIAAHHDVTAATHTAVYFGTIDGGEPRRIVGSSTAAVYADGYLLYLRDNTLVATPFDPDRGEFTGEPQPLTDKVQYDRTTWRASFSASQTGALAYHASTSEVLNGTKIAVFDRAGNETRVIDQTWAYYHLSLSPDNRHLASCIATDGGTTAALDIWVYDLDRGLKTRVTFNEGADISPMWSPDGTQVAYATFSAVRGHPNSVRVVDAGGGNERIVQESEKEMWVTDWSADGKYLIIGMGDFVGNQASNDNDVWALPLAEGDEPFAVLDTDFSEDNATLSPDGRWMAFNSTESGVNDIYVTAFPRPGESARTRGKWQISLDGGSGPLWSGDGTELFFFKADGTLWHADIDGSGETLRVGEVSVLFRADPWNYGRIAYDTSLDGEMFVINTFSSSATPPIVLVTNWHADLER